jgi:hypothetical protein
MKNWKVFCSFVGFWDKCCNVEAMGWLVLIYGLVLFVLFLMISRLMPLF